MKMDYNRMRNHKTRSRPTGATQPDLEADPGAFSREECRHSRHGVSTSRNVVCFSRTSCGSPERRRKLMGEALEVLYPRCCGLDVHKKTVVACALITPPHGPVQKHFQTFSTMTNGLLALLDWLASMQVSHV